MSADLMKARREDVLARLEEFLRDNPKSIRQLALETGISKHTFHAFLKGGRNINIKTMGMIDRYIKEYKASADSFLKTSHKGCINEQE